MAHKKFRSPFADHEPETVQPEPVKDEWEPVNLSQSEQSDLIRRIERSAPNVSKDGVAAIITLSPCKRIRMTKTDEGMTWEVSMT